MVVRVEDGKPVYEGQQIKIGGNESYYPVCRVHYQKNADLRKELSMDKIIEQIMVFVSRYEELQEMMSDPEVINDTKRYMEITKEEASLREIVAKFKRYQEVTEAIADNEELIKDDSDAEITELAKAELSELSDEKKELEEKLTILMLPKDPNDDKNIIMEIRGAAGGDEASLFAKNLFHMYQKYAESQKWTIELIDEVETEVGGYKQVAFMINGENVFF